MQPVTPSAPQQPSVPDILCRYPGIKNLYERVHQIGSSFTCPENVEKTGAMKAWALLQSSSTDANNQLDRLAIAVKVAAQYLGMPTPNLQKWDEGVRLSLHLLEKKADGLVTPYPRRDGQLPLSGYEQGLTGPSSIVHQYVWKRGLEETSEWKLAGGDK